MAFISAAIACLKCHYIRYPCCISVISHYCKYFTDVQACRQALPMRFCKDNKLIPSQMSFR